MDERHKMTKDSRADVAVLLVAGVGRRLGQAPGQPKVLLRLGGRSLLERHFAALAAAGVTRFVLTVGYAEEAIRAEVARLGLQTQTRFVVNPHYREGSLLSLAAQTETLTAGAPVLLMDGDVLYDPAMLVRLQAVPGENALLVDRHIEPGDEPVKACFRAGRLMDFGKLPEDSGEWHGESVGFFRFSAEGAAALAAACTHRAAQGPASLEYEDAIRDLVRADPDRFDYADISDLAWTEIDFPADLVRARDTVLPHLPG